MGRRALLIQRAIADREKVDPMPIEVPAFQAPEPLTDLVRRLVREQFSRIAAQDGHETFDEADDFDFDEEPEWVSPYEVRDLIPETPEVLGDDPPDSSPAKPLDATGSGSEPPQAAAAG